MRHRWPLSVHRFIYVAIDESMKVHPLLIREGVGQQNDGSECAGFCGDRKLGLIEVIPNLDCHETNEQAEYDPKWR